MKKLLSLSLLAVGMTGLALGQNGQGQNGQGQNGQGQNGHKAPEIDPSQAASALALLSGGILIVRRKK